MVRGSLTLGVVWVRSVFGMKEVMALAGWIGLANEKAFSGNINENPSQVCIRARDMVLIGTQCSFQKAEGSVETLPIGLLVCI